MAKVLRNQKKDVTCIGVLIETAYDRGRSMVDGILSYVQNSGSMRVQIKSTDLDKDHEHFLQYSQLDGIIADVGSEAMAEKLSSSGLPIINVSNESICGFSASRVHTDDRKIIRLAAEHLVEHGFQQFAFVGPIHRSNPRWYSNAFDQFLKERGSSCHIFESTEGAVVSSERLMDWIGTLPGPVGILVWDTEWGKVVVESCLDAGIAVPSDAAVLCCNDDELLARSCRPALSGVALPNKQIGYRAAERLDMMMEGNERHEVDALQLDPLGINERSSTNIFSTDDPQMKKAADYIKQHAYGKIKTEDLLNVVPMSRRSFERRFMQVFGRTPFQAIRIQRIKKARKLLRDTDFKMQEIAEACGLESYNYLSSIFKEATGESPRQFRAKCRVC